VTPDRPAGPTANLESVLHDTALAREYFFGQFPTVFSGHRSLQRLQEGRSDTAVIQELLSAVVDSDSRELAKKLVMSAFVRILESPPSTDIKYQNCTEVSTPSVYIFNAALSRVGRSEREIHAFASRNQGVQRPL
jgi:hypothetical protein